MLTALSIRTWSALALALGASGPFIFLVLFTFFPKAEQTTLSTSSLPSLSMLVGAGGALALFCWMAFRHFCKPIQQVSRAAKGVARGDAVETFRPTPLVEFNEMSTALLSLNHELRSTQERVEDTVRQRSSDLAKERSILASALDSLPDAVIAVSESDGTILHANDLAADLFCRLGSLPGLDSELVAKEVRGWFDEPREWTSWWKVKKIASLGFAKRFEVHHANIRQLEVIGSATYGQDSDESAAIRTWIFRDLTGAAAHATKESNQAKIHAMGRFSEEVANDFNNALSAIQGSLDLALLQVSDEDDPSDALAIANEACVRGGQVVEQLLSLSTRSRSRRRHSTPFEDDP